MTECEKMCEKSPKIFSTFVVENSEGEKGVKSVIAAEIKKPKQNEFVSHMYEIYSLEEFRDNRMEINLLHENNKKAVIQVVLFERNGV
jgi:hypothetical protein